MFDFYDVVLEVYIESQMVSKQTMKAPKEILMIQFMQMAEQIRNDQRPMKIRMIRPEEIWDKFENKYKILNNEIVASNNAMVSWETNKQ